MRLGSWNPDHSLIRIHPVLDSPRVPEHVVGFVVFHEMLHAMLGKEIHGQRELSHGPEFRRQERAHPDHSRAEAWIQRHLKSLLSF